MDSKLQVGHVLVGDLIRSVRLSAFLVSVLPAIQHAIYCNNNDEDPVTSTSFDVRSRKGNSNMTG